MATTDDLLGSARAGPPPLAVRRTGALPDTAENAEQQSSVSRLSVACERRQGIVLLTLEGPLDIYTVRAFRQLVEPLGPATVQMVIDLTGVTLLDSAGLGALVSLRNEAHRGGGHLGLICPDRRMLRLFGFAGMSDSFTFTTDLGSTRPAVRPARYAGGQRYAGRTRSPARRTSTTRRGASSWCT
jgi:anti-anti-sigma factor